MFFYERGNSQNHSAKRYKTGKSVSWSEVFTLLIKNGHDAQQLPHYTQRQLLLYYDELIKLQNRERANRIEDICVGFNGGKQVTKFVKQLRGEQ
ncbi:MULTISPECIES: hypothetical protein [unclassified Gilliamella]|uniref:hypothetical protein n=1 Tax=unclassified Gilliamella TaxID=2685620 RepID=UPI0011471546|nr:hypothetical protein [Gilliamella apicola]